MTNFGRDHWLVCVRDKVRWYIGSNLFSGWREEDPADQGAQWAAVERFRVVEPLRFGRDPTGDQE
jgi:hypothetical protein